ncbi:IS30 family transposase [Halpernia frigidisoli]|uniref:Transposase and inactivated derivatives, IS30 family n=1 Tax=Halpernia frigidisoli TaxID=1125876 RepID=A0A1I3E1I5_9FLAO|nr:IS30 family transposase [Halpernia frigidisoli]SFH92854.1 Transposase and inactivated derivatives, IS30 family [Halpernia frigidisoli]
MKKYKHLAPEQRYQLSALLETKISKTQIAVIIGVDRSTIYRELQRNIPERGSTAKRYIAQHAQNKTDKRHREKRKAMVLTDELKLRISGLMMHEKWSPELIAKRLAADGECQISHETIYKWIWTAKHSNREEHKEYKTLCKHLRYTGRQQKRYNEKDKRGAIIGRIGIDKRPKIVEERSRIGDIEVDLMMGSNHKSALLVMTDRTTLVTMIEKLKSKNAEEVYQKMNTRLIRFDSSWIKTITFDNGKEFAYHHKIGKDLNASTYFTRPYTSQDKGTVENRIGVIRRFFPKKTDLRNISEARIKEVEKLLNYRPIRKFNYKNPIEVLHNKIVALIG